VRGRAAGCAHPLEKSAPNFADYLFSELRTDGILRSSHLTPFESMMRSLGEWEFAGMRGSAKVSEQASVLGKNPRMGRVVLLLSGPMLFCLGILLSLLATTASEAASAPMSADAGYVHGGVLVPLAEDGSYLLTPADEAQEQEKHPVNFSVLTMLVLIITSLFVASILWLLMRSPRRREAIRLCRGTEEGRRWLVGTHDGPSLLGVFLL
jgi:hypothetical protein